MKINLHTHQKSKNQDSLAIVNQYPMDFDSSASFFSIGIHPWYIHPNAIEEELILVDEYAQKDNALAIGECGLDKRIEISMDIQEYVFEKQMQLAEKYKKPLIIHCVAAFSEIIALKNKNKITVPLIFHGFSKNIQTAQMLLKNGCYLSFGKNLMQNQSLSPVFKEIPLNRIFLETDAMEEPIEAVYDKASEILGISEIELKSQILNNTQDVFGFSKSLQKFIQ